MVLVSSMLRSFMVERTDGSLRRNKGMVQWPLPMYGESGWEIRAVVSL